MSRSARWILPRAPRRAAIGALRIYQPVTARSRLGWRALRGIAAAGGLRLFPGFAEPPTLVLELLRPYVGACSEIALAKSNHPGRFIVFVLHESGECSAVAKVATDEGGQAALAKEANSLREVASALPPPLSASRLLVQEPGLILLEPVPWLPRRRPWQLPEEVAFALGRFFRSGATGGHGFHGCTHGDFAPWNLLRTAGGWVLIDWEAARPDGPAFFDLFHYLVQSHALLGRPRRRTLLRDIEGHGWVGAAIQAYADGAGISAQAAPAAFVSYLRTSAESLRPSSTDGRAGIRARRELLATLTT